MPRGLFPEEPEPEPPRAAREAQSAPAARLFLLDGTALAYRSHYALLKNPLTTSGACGLLNPSRIAWTQPVASSVPASVTRIKSLTAACR